MTADRARWPVAVAVLVAVVLAGVVLAGGPPAVSAPTADDGPAFRFVDVAADAGFDYAATATGVGNGNDGVYVTDFDGDGWPDVLAIGGERPVLFENVGGAFERSEALPRIDGTVQGALFFDADRDGREDLLLLRRGDRAVFLRNTGGAFQRQTVGLEVPLEVPVGATAADYDGDGYVDVFVAQYGDWGETTPAGYANPGRMTEDNGNPNYLFRGGPAGFERATDAGIEGARWSLATSFVDLTGDGRPDVHVANDFNNDTVHVNRGDGTFHTRSLGPATDRNGMSSEVTDVNRDGRPDLLVTNIYLPTSSGEISAEKRRLLENYQRFVLGKRSEGNTLLVNRGNATFEDEAADYGVAEGGWGWAAVSTDFDSDGDDDLFHTTQRVIRVNDSDPHYTYPMLWRRAGDAFVGLDASEAGLAETNGRGAAELDFDRDGDADLAVATYGGRYRLYENRIDGGASLEVAVATDGGRDAPGVRRVCVVAGDRSQCERTNAKADYQSQDTRTLHFGLGDRTVERLVVVRDDGNRKVVTDVAAGQTVVVDGTGVRRRVPYANRSAGDADRTLPPEAAHR